MTRLKEIPWHLRDQIPSDVRTPNDWSHAKFDAEFKKLVLGLGYLAYHTHDSRRSEPGFPDWLIIKGKRIMVWELKVGKDKPSPEQEKWLKAFRGARVEAYIGRPFLWDDIVKIIKA